MATILEFPEIQLNGSLQVNHSATGDQSHTISNIIIFPGIRRERKNEANEQPSKSQVQLKSLETGHH